MKKIITLSALFITFFVFAQVPQGISYQAIALNGSGNPVVSSNVGLRLSVLDNSATGTLLYTETHTKTTNAQGLFNLVIGQGTPTSGTFSAINWATNSKFLKVEMDVAGGTNYVLVGTTQLLSVPYALAAGSLSGTNANDSIENNKFSNFAFSNSLEGKTYAYNQLTGTWVSVNSYGSLIGSNGNFAITNSLQGMTYAFNKNTGTWVSINSNGSIIASNGNFAFTNSLQGMTYVFNKNTGTWVSVNSNGSLISSNGNFAFTNSLQGMTYAFNKNTGTWVSVNSNGSIVESNGNFAFTNSLEGKTYVFDTSLNQWISVNSNGSIVISPSN